jgi:hypothetical protein
MAQTNLVLNGDFEQYNGCPQDFDDLTVSYWTGIDSLMQYNCDKLDYCHTCAKQNVTIPNGRFYYQYPHSGNAFMLVQFHYDDGNDTNFWNHYLQGRLSKKLTAGKKYCVSFWVSTAEGSKYAIKEISAYLDNGTIDTARLCGAPQTQYTPQITNNGGIISDTTNWIKIEGSFVAKGNEQFITIGNYKSRQQTTKITLPDNSYTSPTHYAAYLVDDVSVTECSVGIEPINTRPQQYTLMPNPNDGYIQLRQLKQDNDPVSVSVYNSLGAIIYKDTKAFEAGSTFVNLSGVASGMYYMILHDSKGTAYTLRFVKK